MLLIGIDCARDDARIGVAFGDYESGAVHVRKVVVCVRERPAALIIAERLPECGASALLAIDAPLGWPEALGRSLMAHRAGESITIPPNDIFRRATDRLFRSTWGRRLSTLGRIASHALRMPCE